MRYLRQVNFKKIKPNITVENINNIHIQVKNANFMSDTGYISIIQTELYIY